nr:9062_t:CDS:10 [Entrophospora candida]
MYVYEPGYGFCSNGARVVSKYCFDHYGDRYKQFFIRCGDYFHELLQHGTEFFVEMGINRLTLACGTGSTSCVALAKRLKLIDQDPSKVTVNVHDALDSFCRKMQQIEKILIANRGEIACRIISTCRHLGISTVAVYSESDKDSLFVKLADESIYIGSNESYLCADKIINAAKRVGADAIHPGSRYGFLSEKSDFAKLVAQSGIRFIGPSPDSILAIVVPLIPGYNGLNQDIDVLINEALRIGFPILLKASSGGGGMGMRIIRDESKLREEIALAKAESLRLFGSENLLIEKYFDSVSHVEYGNIYHCFERDCSIQRRHQKVIEETPSPNLDSTLRSEMISVSIQIGKLLKYEGVGTIEFIVDKLEKKFYFLEMNTRLQVEHPITELVTGLDLVELQILVSQGYELSSSPLPNLTSIGHAIECRLYSEDPSKNFLPSTGKLLYWKQASIPNVRYDTGVETGSVISMYYDPLISKISVLAPTRQQAIQKMHLALRNTICLGLVTNQSFLTKVMKNNNFNKGFYNTNFVENEYSNNNISSNVVGENETIKNLGIVAFLWLWHLREKQRTTLRHIPSRWRYLKYKNPIEIYNVYHDNITTNSTKNNLIEIEYECQNYKIDGTKLNSIDDDNYKFCILARYLNGIDANVDGGDELIKKKDVLLNGVIINENNEGIQRIYEIANDSNSNCVYVHSQDLSKQIKFIKKERHKTAAEDIEDDVLPYVAPMPCKILRLLVNPNSKVKKNTPILTIETMKIEIKIFSKHDGIIKFLVKEGDIVDAGALLVKIE